MLAMQGQQSQGKIRSKLESHRLGLKIIYCLEMGVSTPLGRPKFSFKEIK